MRRDGNVSDASPIVREKDQHEQEAVRRGRDDEEISRHDLADMISQECLPGLRGRLAPTSHVFGDVACETSIPSFSSSPWIRGAPQSGFA